MIISDGEVFQEYEARCMVPDPTNAEVAGYTMDELLSAVPETLKTFSQRIAICLLDERVRISMMFVKLISRLDRGISMLKNTS